MASLSRNSIIGSLAVLAFLVIGAGGCIWFAEDGLEELAEKPCDGLVDGETIRRVLPNSHHVEVGSNDAHSSAKSNFRQSCFFLADGRESTIYIAVRTTVDAFDYGHSKEKAWMESGKHFERHPKGIISIGETRIVDAVVPCPVPEQKNNALGVSVETSGELRIGGKELRESLEDLALQALRDASHRLSC